VSLSYHPKLYKNHLTTTQSWSGEIMNLYKAISPFEEMSREKIIFTVPIFGNYGLETGTKIHIK
jgi:hypothetical protein